MNVDNYNLFVGSTTGMLKGVYVGKDELNVKVVTKNCIRSRELISNKNEITCLTWSSNSEEEIIVGMKNKIRIFNVDTEEISDDHHLPEGDVCGIFKHEDTLFIALTTGSIKAWQYPFKEAELREQLNVNRNIEKMKRGIINSNLIATGGKDNDLKVWDLNTKKAIFQAKNVKPDELQLQVPIWVSDITFFPQSDKIASCTRHGFVRLYDPLLPQRRPILNAHEPDEVFTCLSRTPNENQLLVGSGYGNLMLVDLRKTNSFAGKYKGFCGAVKSITCPSNQSLVLSASLDRHFRIHDFTTRKLLVKEYMQSRLTTLLPKESFELKKFKSEVEPPSKFTKKHKRKNSETPVNFEQSMKDIGFEESEESDFESNTPAKKNKMKSNEEDKQKEITKKIKWKKTK